MAAKEKKTGAELATIIMQQIRKHADCNDITSVAIIKPVQQVEHDPSWRFAWTRDYTSNRPPALADDIARALQSQFDLA